MQPASAKTTMENRRKRSSSGEIFSFPSTPIQDSDFEFGCLTPDSPSQDPSTNSPADHLFFNGRLLPHSFPFHQRQPPPGALILSPDNISRATSRTSSVSSKDSLMSSRSNSTNSRRSSSFTSTSSARTSSSSVNYSEGRKFLYYYNNKAQCSSSRATMASKMVTAQLYGSSQRWQYLTPVPTLKREASQRQNNGGGSSGGRWRSKKKIRTGGGDHHKRSMGGICRTIFMAFLFACRECHAMEP